MEQLNYEKYFNYNRESILYIKELRELFYHVGIVDLNYKVFANKRVKLMFDIISKELLENSEEFGGNFQIKGEFFLPDELKEDFNQERVLLVEDCILKEEDTLKVANEILKRNGFPPVWTNYSIPRKSEFLKNI